MTRDTTASAIAARLRADINEGLWPSGAALRQEELADRYGASRIPIREALGLLRADGLVAIEPHRGAFVVSLSVSEAVEIFDLRVLLEVSALGHAVPRHTPKTLARLEGLQAELEVEDQRGAWIDKDRAFHEALYAPSGRQRTLEMIRALRAQVERFGLPRLGPGARRREWASEHRQLIAAVASKNARAAKDAITRHLRETQAAVCSAIEASSTANQEPPHV